MDFTHHFHCVFLHTVPRYVLLMPMQDSSPPVVSKKYAGKWIVWNREQTKILGSGDTLHQVREAVNAKDTSQAVFATAPKEDIRFVGTV